MSPDPKEGRGSRGIQSIEVGGQLLLALAHQGQPMALKDLARDAGMTPAKAHPYLVSFGKLGLIEQEAGSGRYGLGPLALQLGLISLQQFDPVRLATPLIEELAQLTGHTMAIAVWGNRGPTIVRIAEAPSPVHVAMRHGTVMSLRGTASGRLFAAYLPRETVLAALATEMDGARLDAEFERELADVREHRISRAQDAAVQGVSAMAAPVFDGSGAMVLSITAIGPSATLDTRWDGPVATALRRCATDLSRRLGAKP
jgi:DNA-binding IclR family transcriptional regulator